MSDDSPLLKLARKLEGRATLDEADRAAIMAMPYEMRTWEPHSYLIREGERTRQNCSFLLSGFAFRQKLTIHGTRQIVALHIPGDIMDLQHLFLKRADHNVQALTRIETAELQRSALRTLALERPAVAEAMWVDGLVDASVFREWVLNVGRRDARTRVAHLLCEFAVRMHAAGLAPNNRYDLPMTQEQLGDATGLTSVHVNRTLRALAGDGLILRDRRSISFANWEHLRRAADFSAMYLHLDQTMVHKD